MYQRSAEEREAAMYGWARRQSDARDAAIVVERRAAEEAMIERAARALLEHQRRIAARDIIHAQMETTEERVARNREAMHAWGRRKSLSRELAVAHAHAERIAAHGSALGPSAADVAAEKVADAEAKSDAAADLSYAAWMVEPAEVFMHGPLAERFAAMRAELHRWWHVDRQRLLEAVEKLGADEAYALDMDAVRAEAVRRRDREASLEEVRPIYSFVCSSILLFAHDISFVCPFVARGDAGGPGRCGRRPWLTGQAAAARGDAGAMGRQCWA